ncbi:putative small GTPase, P-loop containing nucleoside triphosphate hydrolase [Helianthus annuus]|nr:putative small GTPase, P-loop containing nucleoside triphosphate hydrolase [Helianthus annuus]
MSQISRKMRRLNLKKTIIWRVSLLRRCARSLWHQILVCWIGKSIRYRQLLNSGSGPLIPTCHRRSVPVEITTVDMATVCQQLPSREMSACGGDGFASGDATSSSGDDQGASDLVALKICVLGDEQIGKTSFLAKYVGKEKNQEELEAKRINHMDKTLRIGEARISYNIWEAGGDALYLEYNSCSLQGLCIAIFFMFDLTSRRTLYSVINWHQQARNYNQTAMLVMVGSKFDEFVQLPWIYNGLSQARAYAKALNATLFFSSASYNINVNKIFKFVTAKLFDIPWTLKRNLTVGEPIIDF